MGAEGRPVVGGCYRRRGWVFKHRAALIQPAGSATLYRMMVKVKICGLTRVDDALRAAAAGADAIGFNFWPGSKRYIAPERALPIRMSLPPFIAAVGLFVDAPLDVIHDAIETCKLDYVQLSGHESRPLVKRIRGAGIIKTVRVRSEADLSELEKHDNVDVFLLDAAVDGMYGGTGETFDWHLARMASSRARIMLAGGLNPHNVQDAIETARPWAVDVASGVEDGTPGVKSRKMMNEFCRAAKSVDV
jgi:phosphoribosylanthranilate isomerase